MAARATSSKRLPSDPETLLELLDALPSDGSDDDFEGYLSEEHDIIDETTGDDAYDCEQSSARPNTHHRAHTG